MAKTRRAATLRASTMRAKVMSRKMAEEMNLPRESEGGLGLSNDPEQVVSGRFASVLTP